MRSKRLTSWKPHDESKTTTTKKKKEKKKEKKTSSITMQRIVSRRERAGAEGKACYEVEREMHDVAQRRRVKRGERGGRGRTGSQESSERRRDRRRQPAITSWNVWERVGLRS
ncbi:hypothetical protein M0802_014260 [Mischocyttarus mexicanus]|nr:hypothetical protein M0802_014263 [Mischocyttarus mexicanus]KAI4480403.1 hypothetical protein M0802_014260 [Mischocyttarus mexicanus]